MEHIFEMLKIKKVHRNLENRDLINILIEEIKKLNIQYKKSMFTN